MNKMLVAIFDTEAAAFEGRTALKDLHRDAEITLYASTILVKDLFGTISIKRVDEQGPAGAAVGFLSGGLIGLIGGPVGLTIGAGIGGLTGMLLDLDRSGMSVAFVEEVSKSLTPGKAAVIADLDEGWTTPVDTRLQQYGAVILRRLRSEVVEDQLNREAAAFESDLKTLEDELRHASAENKAAIQKNIDAVKKQLQATQDQAKARLEDVRAESDAKLKALEDQARGANERTKARIDKRVAAVKADFATRSKKLSQAWELTKEALAA